VQSFAHAQLNAQYYPKPMVTKIGSGSPLTSYDELVSETLSRSRQQVNSRQNNNNMPSFHNNRSNSVTSMPEYIGTQEMQVLRNNLAAAQRQDLYCQ